MNRTPASKRKITNTTSTIEPPPAKRAKSEKPKNNPPRKRKITGTTSTSRAKRVKKSKADFLWIDTGESVVLSDEEIKKLSLRGCRYISREARFITSGSELHTHNPVWLSNKEPISREDFAALEEKASNTSTSSSSASFPASWDELWRRVAGGENITLGNDIILSCSRYYKQTPVYYGLKGSMAEVKNEQPITLIEKDKYGQEQKQEIPSGAKVKLFQLLHKRGEDGNPPDALKVCVSGQNRYVMLKSKSSSNAPCYLLTGEKVLAGAKDQLYLKEDCTTFATLAELTTALTNHKGPLTVYRKGADGEPSEEVCLISAKTLSCSRPHYVATSAKVLGGAKDQLYLKEDCTGTFASQAELTAAVIQHKGPLTVYRKGTDGEPSEEVCLIRTNALLQSKPHYVATGAKVLGGAKDHLYLKKDCTTFATQAELTAALIKHKGHLTVYRKGADGEPSEEVCLISATSLSKSRPHYLATGAKVLGGAKDQLYLKEDCTGTFATQAELTAALIKHKGRLTVYRKGTDGEPFEEVCLISVKTLSQSKPHYVATSATVLGGAKDQLYLKKDCTGTFATQAELTAALINIEGKYLTVYRKGADGEPSEEVRLISANALSKSRPHYVATGATVLGGAKDHLYLKEDCTGTFATQAELTAALIKHKWHLTVYRKGADGEPFEEVRLISTNVLSHSRPHYLATGAKVLAGAKEQLYLKEDCTGTFATQAELTAALIKKHKGRLTVYRKVSEESIEEVKLTTEAIFRYLNTPVFKDSGEIVPRQYKKTCKEQLSSNESYLLFLEEGETAFVVRRSKYLFEQKQRVSSPSNSRDTPMDIDNKFEDIPFDDEDWLFEQAHKQAHEQADGYNWFHDEQAAAEDSLDDEWLHDEQAGLESQYKQPELFPSFFTPPPQGVTLSPPEEVPPLSPFSFSK